MSVKISSTSEYLKNLNELIEKEPSYVKILIQDLPDSSGRHNGSSSSLLFSKLSSSRTDTLLYCKLLNILLNRLSVSARRSKQAFTTMWDKLKKSLEIILNDALLVIFDYNYEMELELELEYLIRRIIQLGINTTVNTSNLHKGSIWMAMDLDVQLGHIEMTKNRQLILENLDSGLNQTTLFLYSKKIQVENFPKILLKIKDPKPELINLYFEKYFNTETLYDLIEQSIQLKIEFIQNLKNIPSFNWLKFDKKVINLLLSKLKVIPSTTKDVCATLDLLSEITMALSLRADCAELLNQLCDIQKSVKIQNMADSAIGKYWSFVSALLSVDGTDFDLENDIIYTLKADEHIKSKTSVCRVIALYWDKLKEKDLITKSLLDTLIQYENNKLRWNIAIAFTGSDANLSTFNFIKDFWIKELENFGNFKVILSFTKLLHKWSIACDVPIGSDALHADLMSKTCERLNLFVRENESNLECEDDEILVVVNARKLELLLRSILIGGAND